MCGIIGYCGAQEAQPILLNGLARLEYRGYDSCGVAIVNDELAVFKDAVRVHQLAKQLPKNAGTIGIGHTRWATHGERSKVNAHPHTDCHGLVAVVHNGTINNFRELREQLAAEGHTLVSETDTEVLAHLIEKYYDGDLVAAVEKTLVDVRGAYTMIAAMAGEPGLVAARKDSPLIIGIGDRENFIASDVPALLDYTGRVVYLEDDDVALVTPVTVGIRQHGKAVPRAEHKVQWSVEDAQKGGYEHFMLKEIHEQPKVIRDTLGGYFAMEEAGQDEAGRPGEDPEGLLIIGCGTSYHAGLIGKYIFERLTGLPVRVEHADEFVYSGKVSPQERALVITQSGETLDALKAVRALKDAGCPVTGISNVVGSTLSRTADRMLYTWAGPETSVAATKTHLAQIIALYWLAVGTAGVEAVQRESLYAGLRQLPVKVQQVLDEQDAIMATAKKLSRYESLFYIGKGLNHPVALEGALKMKEISYAHAEGYAAGELKHGPFALLGEGTPVVAVIAPDNTREPMMTSLKEIKARHSPVVALTTEDDSDVAGLADLLITVPAVEPLFTPVVNTVALQLLAYYCARERGCPIDFPRNLAKTVTVE
jgi:glucosamine--fructose-6-phosphate aminotransferase (isomerizing)